MDLTFHTKKKVELKFDRKIDLHEWIVGQKKG